MLLILPRILPGATVLLTLNIAPVSVLAKSARCFTTDDGNYPCEFTSTDKDGSFQITGRGKPTFMLNMTEPGHASGSADFGGRNVNLPGEYLRDPTDPACWANDSTHSRICAR